MDSCDLHYYFSTFAVYEGSNNAHSNVREIFGTNGIGEELSEIVSESTIALIFVAVIFIVFIVVNYDGMFVEGTPLHVKIIITFAFNYPVGLLYVSDVSFLHWVR